MRSGTLPITVRYNNKRAKAGRLKRGLLFAALLFALPFGSRAQNTAPSFINSSPVTISSVCGNLPKDISSYLIVTDADGTDIETWYEQSAPNAGGTLSLSYSETGPVAAPVMGTTATPSGIIYTPSAALSAVGGTESFTIGVNDGAGHDVYMVVNVNVIPGPTLTLGTMPSVCAGSNTATIPVSGMSNIGAASTVFTYVGPTGQTWTVPSFITAVDFDANGASGGNDNVSTAPVAGKGGNIQGHLTVTPGSVLNIFVGGRGGNSTPTGATGGYNGGGNASFYVFGSGGGGGGASDIRIGGTTLSDRVVVAGGGGGTGYDAGISMAGGNGGGLIGGPGSNNLGGFHANGGTQSSGGTGSIYPGRIPGGNGSLAVGGNSSTQGISGAGGGGFYGGGGGIWNGGAGGSSFANAILTSSVVTTPGTNTGNGVVTISYSIPGTYDITWDATASAAGFTDVSGATFPSSSINVDVPTTLSPTAATTYSGVLTVNNGTCQSESYTIYVTILPVPSVAVPANQTVCNGDATAAINFVNDPIAATTLTNKWHNDNPLIGLADSSTGNIPSFTPVNTTTAPVVAHITVTPVADGCAGTPQTFQIVDNPIPALSSPTTASVCDSALFSYVPASATAGTSFAWSRGAVAGIANPAFAGTGNIAENLDNTTPNPVVVTYIETLTANGCSNTANVTVSVNPQPALTSTPNPAAICDSTTFNYTPGTATTGAVLTWSRAAVAGISNAAATGTGNISEVLHNTTTSPVTVTYTYTIDINGCTGTANVSVVVNPTPRLTSATTMPATCDNSPFTYNQASTVPGTSYRWSRPTIPGITPATGNGTGNIVETLHNATALPVTVMYVDSLSAFGCTSVYNLSIVINPMPSLTSTLTPGSICTNTLFSYTPSTATPGTTLVWARDHIIGIANDSARGTNNISEVLIDTLDIPVVATYHYILTAGSCINTQAVNVIVNPKPKLSNASTTVSVCDSQVFNFIPASGTAGTTFSWSRAYVSGIAQLPNNGTNNPNELLVNNTNVSVDAIYVYTLTANGCTNTQNVTATVRPKPKLSSLTSRSACTGSPFTYSPLSFTPGTTFTWSRSPVGGISPGFSSGSGDINETLTSTSSSTVPVVYVYTLNIAGCVNTQNVTVNVNPGPAVPAISAPALNLCANSMFATFSAATAPPAGITYSWSASNAIVWATGTTKQYALINFYTPGTAVITLTATQGGVTCSSSTSYSVNVGSGGASTPVIIYFAGQFIAQQADADSYQWGYDDASTLASHVLTGETNQNFAEPAPDPNKLYWVMTTHNGCTQKTYYKAPAGVEELATAGGMNVYPNPAENFVNVEVNAAVSGNVQVEMFNLLGQKINTVTAEDHKARLDVSGLPAGCYIIDCMSDGVKIASARFIKN